MADKPFRFGPLALTNTYTTNILNPGTTTGGTNSTASPYDKLRIMLSKIRIVNKTAGAVTFRLYIDTTGGNTAGKELAYDFSVAAASAYEMTGRLVLDSADFLVGGASASTSLTIEGEGTIGIAN